MKRAGMICHHVEWDRSGKIVRQLWRPANADQMPANPAPEPAEKPKVERGVRPSPKAEQDRLL